MLVLLRTINKFHCEKKLWLLTRHISHTSIYINRPLFDSSTYNVSLIKRFENTKIEKKPQDGNKEVKPAVTSPSLKEKLKQAVAEYGSTVIIFHVGISLISLGTCYLLISSGLDVSKVLIPLGISDETASKIATNAGTFALAYAVHKVFAPVRIAITLTATPFIVRYLRKIGFLRKTK